MKKIINGPLFANLCLIGFFILIFLTTFTNFNLSLSISTTQGFVYHLIVFILIIVFGVLSSVFLSIKNKFIANAFFAMGFVYLISNSLTVILIKNSAFDIETSTRLIGLAQIAANLVLAYFLICFQKEIISKTVVRSILIGVLIFALIPCFYSLFYQADTIINSFKAEHATLYQISSYFSDKNTFGYFLFFGSIAVILLAIFEQRKIYYLFLIPLWIFLVISRAKTPLIITTLILIALFVYYAITDFKNNKKTWIISFSLIGSLIATFTILLLLGINENSPLHQFSYYFTNTLIKDGQATLSARFDKWHKISSLFASPYILSGFGERTYILFLNKLFNETGIQADNVLITEMLQGGIIKVVLYFVFFFSIFYRGFMLINNKKICICYLVFAIAIIIYGTFEDLEVVATRSYSLLAGSLLTFIPSFYLSYKNK